MITRILILALIVGLVYLNYTVPTEQEHQTAILAQLEQSWPIPDKIQTAIWHNVDYSNFLVCSFMKTTEGSKMISSGYLKKVNVINDQWFKETRQSLQKKLAY